MVSEVSQSGRFGADRLTELPGSGLSYVRFESGSMLEPYRSVLAPKFIRLWASALSRSEDDPLVVTDSASFPYVSEDGVSLVTDYRGEIAAIFLFRNVTLQGRSGLYAMTCLVHEAYQGRGITPLLIRQEIAEAGPSFVVLNTQNTHMVQVLRKFSANGLLFPIDGNIPDVIDRMGREFTRHPDRYDAQHMVSKGLYRNGNPLYGDRRERMSSHPDIAEFFRQHVDFQHGDAVLAIGVLDPGLLET